MIAKAMENLRSANILVERCPNAAASRAYYAAYQACWWILDKRGETPPKVRRGMRYWPHDGIAQAVRSRGDIDFDDDMEDDFDNILLSYRIKADYDEDDITEPEARTSIEVAEAVLETVQAKNHE
jgi:uncharacterized protein (UPF0332 family)